MTYTQCVLAWHISIEWIFHWILFHGLALLSSSLCALLLAFSPGWHYVTEASIWPHFHLLKGAATVEWFPAGGLESCCFSNSIMLWIHTDYYLVPAAYHYVNCHNCKCFPYRVNLECCSESFSGLFFLLFQLLNFGWSKMTVEEVFFGQHCSHFLKYASKSPNNYRVSFAPLTIASVHLCLAALVYETRWLLAPFEAMCPLCSSLKVAEYKQPR